MKRIYLFFVIALGTEWGTSPITAAEADATEDRLKACAKIVDDEARIACYESLGKESLAEEQSEISANAAGNMASTTEVAASSAAVATGTVPETSAPTNVPIKGDSPPEEYRVAVSSCRIMKGGDTYFLLENGETWKRTGGQQLRESECSFSATLSKDFFGYKMLIDGDKGSVRVKRVK